MPEDQDIKKVEDKPAEPAGAVANDSLSPAPGSAPETMPKEAEEPLFPLEQFVNDAPAPKQETQTAGQAPPSTTTAPAAQPTTSPPPTAPPSSSPAQSATAPTAVKPPEVPKDYPPEAAKGEKKGIFSFFKRKPKDSDATKANLAKPTAPNGSKAIIRRSSSAGKIILTCLFIIVILAVVFYIFFYKVTISINTTPAPDTIIIDSKSVTAGTHKLNPGFHDIKIEKNGYVSYYKSRKFTIGEKLDLSFNLLKSQSGNQAVAGAKSISLSASGKYINFLGQDARLYSLALDDPKATPVALSLEQFSPIRQIKFSLNNNFALILDDEALRIADFAKLDPTTQDKSVPLPPAASAISSISWNNKKTSYVAEANSKILYDLKTTSSWDLMMLDRSNGHSQIVMTIDAARYPKFNVDWGDSDRMALLTGDEAGLLDLGTREYTALEEKGGYNSGRWAPGGLYAVLTKSSGQAFLLKDGKLQDLEIKTNNFFFKSKNEAYFIEGEKVVLVNFDTNSRINYAEVSGLKDAVSFIVYSDSVYFLDSSGLKTAKLQQGAYEASAK